MSTKGVSSILGEVTLVAKIFRQDNTYLSCSRVSFFFLFFSFILSIESITDNVFKVIDHSICLNIWFLASVNLSNNKYNSERTLKQSKYTF